MTRVHKIDWELVILVLTFPLWSPYVGLYLMWEWISDIPNDWRLYRKQARIKSAPIKYPRWKPKRRNPMRSY